MRSSYLENKYGEIFYSIVTAHRPANAVELGVLDGYSTYHIARGLKRNKSIPGVSAHLDSYDLWDDYAYNHGEMKNVKDMLETAGLLDYVSLKKGDAFKVHENYNTGSIYFLHVDISNTGQIVKDIMSLWDPKMIQGGLILFEGGTEERDNIEWMRKYEAPPIKVEIETNPIINSKYVYATYLKYPGLTVLLKKEP